jgi:NOL1/NOP2/fmu family ribosome biogenesis protein
MWVIGEMVGAGDEVEEQKWSWLGEGKQVGGQVKNSFLC